MLTIYKPYIKNIDDFLDKSMRNPKDSFSSHLCGYMSYEEFPKEIMMKILHAMIALDFHRTEEKKIGLDHEYYPTFNCKNKATAGVEEIYYESFEILIVNDHMGLGEEHFFRLDDGNNDID